MLTFHLNFVQETYLHDYPDSEEVSLKGNVYNFSVDYDAINKSDVLNIHKYLMTKNIKQVFIIIKQVFIILLRYSSSLARAAKFRTKCLSLNDETCMV